MHYFDYNATSPLHPEAKVAWLEAQENYWQNPSSPHSSGQKVRARLEICREEIAQLWNVPSSEVVFTSGATESANRVIQYLSTYTKGIIWRSGQEHSCVSESMKKYFADRTSILSLENSDVSPPSEYQNLIGKKDIVVLQAANHETGIIHDWSTWAKFCEELRIPFVCDQTQIFGKIPLTSLAKTTWAFASGHKFGAPKGVGILRVPSEYSGFTSQVGGYHQEGYRAGTEDFPAISAMVAALKAQQINSTDLSAISTRLDWQDEFINKILSKIPESEVAAAQTVNRLWNTVLLRLPKGDQLSWVRKLDKEGFCISTGSACSTNNNLSPTLLSLGYEPEEIKQFIRISSGWTTKQADWQALAKTIITLWQNTEDKSSAEDLTEVITI